MESGSADNRDLLLSSVDVLYFNEVATDWIFMSCLFTIKMFVYDYCLMCAEYYIQYT